MFRGEVSYTRQQTNMEDIVKDSRFAHTAKDPRFKPNLKQKKVKLDSRFKSILKDEDFNVKFMDKRGRPINKSSKENLGRLYDYNSDEEEESSEEGESLDDKDEKAAPSSGEEEEDGENEKDEKVALSSGEEEEDSEDEEEEAEDEPQSVEDGGSEGNESSDEDDGEEMPEITEDGPDYARGGGLLDSSDEEEESEEEEEHGLLAHDWNEPDRNAPEAEDVSARLALCNMDWDRIKARDLYVLFNSFVPQGGAVQSVTIYPSQVGKEKMAEEEKLGPREFREGTATKKDEGMRKLDRAKLRQYQLNRLAYFYAVIVCDSKDTASKIYEECDSMEYEKSSCRIDLRFIPDDMTFDETPKDSSTGVSESDLSSFTPSTFTTTAFCRANVQVTWDETNIDRLHKTMKQKFTDEDLETDQFDDLIASFDEGSSDEGSDKDKRKKSGKKGKKKKKGEKKEMKNYRKLLGLEDDKSKKKKNGSVVPFVGEDDDDDEVMDFTTNLNDKKKEKGKASKKNKPASESEDEEDEESEEENGEMEFTWESGGNLQNLQKQGKEKLTPWEQYQQKKKDKKKLKKRDRKMERLKQKGIDVSTDLGFDDDFFKDDPDIGKKKDKKKDKKKKKKGQVLNEEETEVDEKEKAALELLVTGEDDHRSHFNLLNLIQEDNSGKKKKGKKRKQADTAEDDAFQVDLNQDRFAGLLTDPEMRIDPNAPEFKKTKAMVTMMEEVVKKRKRVCDV